MISLDDVAEHVRNFGGGGCRLAVERLLVAIKATTLREFVDSLIDMTTSGACEFADEWVRVLIEVRVVVHISIKPYL